MCPGENEKSMEQFLKEREEFLKEKEQGNSNDKDDLHKVMDDIEILDL